MMALTNGANRVMFAKKPLMNAFPRPETGILLRKSSGVA
jgi:hypothetical protein